MSLNEELTREQAHELLDLCWGDGSGNLEVDALAKRCVLRKSSETLYGLPVKGVEY